MIMILLGVLAFIVLAVIAGFVASSDWKRSNDRDTDAKKDNIDPKI